MAIYSLNQSTQLLSLDTYNTILFPVEERKLEENSIEN